MNMYRKLLLVLLANCFALLPSAWGTIHDVSIVDFSFSPPTVNATAGDTVRWTNNGNFTHTSTSNTAVWNSGNLAGGGVGVFSRQFNTGGSFPYHCAIHPSMMATINVTEPNQNPNLVVPGTQNVVAPGGSVNFNVSATDPNMSQVVTISFSGMNPTAPATTPNFIAGNPASFSWSPACQDASPAGYYAVFMASDGNGGTDKDSVKINVSCTVHYIKMINLQFVPQVETVGVGEKVCWVHQDSLCTSPCYHTTTSDSGLWNSDSMFTNDTFCVIFDSSGVFPYQCIPHGPGGMTGSIVVPCLHLAGDATGNFGYSLADAISIVNYAFNKPGCSPAPLCWLGGLLCRGDWTGEGNVALNDAIRSVNFAFNKPCSGPGTPPCCWKPTKVGECCRNLPPPCGP